MADLDRIKVKHQEEIAALEKDMGTKREAEQSKLQKRLAAKRAKRAKQKEKKSAEETEAEEAKIREEEEAEQRALEARLAPRRHSHPRSSSRPRPCPRPCPRPGPQLLHCRTPTSPRPGWMRSRRLPLR